MPTAQVYYKEVAPFYRNYREKMFEDDDFMIRAHRGTEFLTACLKKRREQLEAKKEEVKI